MTYLERLAAGATWNPSDELIKACENTLVAKANVKMIKPRVEGYQKAILKAGNFHVSKEIQEQLRKAGAEIKNTRILDPSLSYQMGDEAFQVYYAACRQAAEDANLKVSAPGNCPLLEAQHLLIRAERELMKLFADEMEAPALADPVLLKHRDKVLECIYNLVVPFVSTPDEVLHRLVA